MERSCEQDGKYRYLLNIPIGNESRKTLFILCNPSTANASRDDPTTGNLKKWARGNGIGIVIVANLYAYRSPHPFALSHLSEAEAVGHKNMAVITRAVSEADEVIVAWGNPPAGRSAKEFEKRTQEVLTVLHQRHEIVYCVGTTNGGHPRHPRVWYMRKNCRKVPFLRLPD